MAKSDLNWPKQSENYCEGFDDEGHWLPEMAYGALNERGSIVDIGQIGPFVRRMLDRLAKQGVVIKYRGYWNTGHASFGMGPLKTIWAVPEAYQQVREFDDGMAARNRRLSEAQAA